MMGNWVFSVGDPYGTYNAYTRLYAYNTDTQAQLTGDVANTTLNSTSKLFIDSGKLYVSPVYFGSYSSSPTQKFAYSNLTDADNFLSNGQFFFCGRVGSFCR